MNENQKLWNSQAKKAAYYISEDKEYIKVKIDGLVTNVPRKVFESIYEIIPND